MEFADVWHTEDVFSVRPLLTTEQANAVLRALRRQHDACLGINWTTIESLSDAMFPGQGGTKDDAEGVCGDGGESESIRIIWNTEDVISVRPDLTEKKANKVLERVMERLDCEIGINWGFISEIADAMYARPLCADSEAVQED